LIFFPFHQNSIGQTTSKIKFKRNTNHWQKSSGKKWWFILTGRLDVQKVIA
jgi:hypothetical protein